MKFKSLVLFLSLTSAVSLNSFAQIQIPQEQLVEQSVAEAQTSTNQNNLTIQVTKDISYKVPLMPDESVGKDDLLSVYRSMPPDQQTQFKNMRVDFLKKAARVLYSTNYVYGYGSLVGSSLSFVKTKIKGQPFANKNKNLTLKEIRYRATQSVLRAVDMKLWSQAPLIIASNEYGLSLSIGLIAAAGYSKNRIGGSEELGVGFAYNKNSKSFVFEIFHSSEKLNSAKTPVGLFAMLFKSGFTVMSREHGQETGLISGQTFNPPALPGYNSYAPNAMSTGGQFVLGVPPTPFSDIMTYSTTFKRNTVIRITISPLIRGFVRIEIGDVLGSIRLVAARFVDTFTLIADRVRHLRGGYRTNLCSGVYSSLPL